MKTLCIHPKDKSTEFLSRIYKGKGWDVVHSWNGSKFDFKNFICCYDRIIMMGHGTPNGLMNVNQFYSEDPNCAFIIDDSFADLLRSKVTITIWCNSDQYASMHCLPGFHTGMIISEVSEAAFVLGHTPLSESETLANMELFADVVGRHIDDLNLLDMQRAIRKEYDGTDPVSVFNRDNIKLVDEDGAIM